MNYLQINSLVLPDYSQKTCLMVMVCTPSLSSKAAFDQPTLVLGAMAECNLSRHTKALRGQLCPMNCSPSVPRKITNMSQRSNQQKYTWGGGGCSPQKKTKPIYQFWCSDWFFFWFFFLGFFVFFFCFFWFFFGFLWFSLVFLVFLGWHSNPEIKCQKTKKSQKKQKKNQKKPKKPKNQFPISNVGQSLSQKKQKNPKKTKKNQFPILNSGQNQCQKKPMPIWKF